jgi:PAS domain S-box-containing protein
MSFQPMLSNKPGATVALILLSLCMAIGYALVFPLLYAHIGVRATELSLIPVLFTGWALGIVPGALAGVVFFAETVVLCTLVSEPTVRDPSNDFPFAILIILIGSTIGYLRTIVLQAKTQAQELKKEREALTIEYAERIRAEDALKGSQDYLEKIINTIADPVAVKDRGHRWVLLNDAYCSFMGYKRDELLGKSDYEFFPQYQADAFRGKDEDVFESGKENISEEEFTDFNNQTHTILTKKTLYINATGEKFIVGIFTDFTGRKRIEAALAREKTFLDSIVEYNPFAIGLVDLNGHVFKCNSAFRTLFGSVPPPQYTVFADPMFASSGYLPYFKKVKDGETIRLPEVWSNPHETDPRAPDVVRCFAATMFPVRDPEGAIAHYVLMYEDISERKRAEERIRNLNVELEIKVQERTALLTKVNAELQQDIAQRRAVENALRESEERYRIMTENMTDMVWLGDFENQTLFFNPAVNMSLGYTHEEFKTLPLEKRVTPASVEAIRRDTQRLIALERQSDPGANRAQPVVLEFVRKDGSTFSAEVSATIIPDSGGKPKSILTVGRDITDRKKIQDALAANERFLRGVFDAIQEGISVLDTNLNIMRVNRTIERLYPHINNFIGRKCYEVFHGRTQGCEICPSRRALADGALHMDVLPLEGPEGITGWHELYAFPLHDSNGAVTGVVEYVRDISDRKRAEDALRESESRLRFIADNMLDMVTQIDSDRMVRYISPSVRSLLGWEPAEITGTRWNDYIHPDDNTQIAHEARSADAVRRPTLHLTYRCRRKDGSYIWLESYSTRFFSSDGRFIGAVFGSRDITESKKAQDALLQSESHLRFVTDNMLDIVLQMDKDRIIKYVSPSSKRLLGYEPAELSGQSIADIIHPDDVKPVMAVVRTALGARNSFITLTYRQRCKDGSYLWIESMVTVIYDSAGRYNSAIFGSRNISERKRAEDALAAEKERLSVTLRSIGDGVITTDVNGSIVMMNKVAEDLTGHTDESSRGMPLQTVFNIVNEETLSPCASPVSAVLESGGIVGLVRHTLLLARDGTQRLIADSGAPIRDHDGRIVGVVIVFRDITERQRMEESLQNTQKIESVGVLAGGIAHDFNNLLTGVQGYVDLARILSGKNKEAVDSLLEAAKVLARAKALTQQLLTFAKGGMPIKKTVSIGEIVRQNVRFVLSGTNVSCAFDIPDSLWMCQADENQIGQVIDNIVINAFQAMPSGGTIKISACNIPEGAALPALLKAGKFVRISIQDQGTGIPQEIISRIFDPFFTTKPKGSGLGLATAYSIVRKHEGCITVASEQDKGALFQVYLPVGTVEAPGETPVPGTVRHGTGKILIMDDEEFVRKVACKMLGNIGYTVEPAVHGMDAIDLFTASFQGGNPFALVILDLTVAGGMGGKETVEILRRIDPDVRAIASSGYSDDPVMAQPQDYGFTASIVKPYSLEELSIVVEKVLLKKDV